MVTTVPAARSLQQAFAARHGRVGLVPFVPAAYPDLETTAACLAALDEAGATAIEIGIPFSDPIADGPVIQAAFTEALARHVRLADVLAMVKGARATVSVPLVAMVSYSIVFRYGLERFLSGARSAGFDAMLVADLPPPEAGAVCAAIRRAGLDTILLVAPTTALERRREIADLCSGFVYYLSVSGITGERASLPTDLAANVASIRALTPLPICVGFGISQPQHVAQLAGVADGAVVGTALVRKIKEHLGQGPAAVARAVAQECRRLMGTCR